MSKPLRLLMVEDTADDASLLLLAVRGGGYEVVCEVVETADGMRAALQRCDWDVVTSDNAMPRFSATEALRLAKALRPGLPFIIVSGEIDFKLAVALMKEGAEDYVQKKELSRICPVIERALRDVGKHRERDVAAQALKISESRYRRLFETARDGILILDANTGRIEDVNPFLIELLGYSRQEIVGKKLWEIGAFSDTQASRNAFAELQTKGYVRYEDLPLETRDRRKIAVEFVSNLYVVDQTKVAQCNIRDLTARKLPDAKIETPNADLERGAQKRAAQLEVINR